MKCPACQSHLAVIDSRDSTHGWRRRRKCEGCGRRMSTIERFESDGQTVNVPLERFKAMRKKVLICDRITAVLAEGEKA